MVLNSVFAALYLRGAPRRSWVPRSGWPAVEALIRRGDLNLGQVANALQRGGRSAEASALSEPHLLAWAEESVETHRVLTPFCAGYPIGWRRYLGDALPLALWMRGRSLEVGNEANYYTVVGSRAPGEASARFAHHFSREAGLAGMPVVSGGAIGIDTACRRGAREVDGPVIEVLPYGLASASFFGSDCDSKGRGWGFDLGSDSGSVAGSDSGSDSGCVEGFGATTQLSVCGPREPFSRGAAMERNLLLYAMSRATIALDPRLKRGGTWWGAIEALRRGIGPVWVGALGGRIPSPPGGSVRPVRHAASGIDSDGIDSGATALRATALGATALGGDLEDRSGTDQACRALVGLGARSLDCFAQSSGFWVGNSCMEERISALASETFAAIRAQEQVLSLADLGYPGQLSLWERYALRS